MKNEFKKIIAEYESNDRMTDDVNNHGKKQRQLPAVKIIDKKLQELGYNMPDRFFHQFAELNGKAVQVAWTGGFDGRNALFNVDLDDIEYTAEDFLKTADLAKFVAEHTTDSYAPKLNLR